MLHTRTLSILLATAMLFACKGETVTDDDDGTDTGTETGTDTGTETDTEGPVDAGNTIEDALEFPLTFGEYTQHVDAIHEGGDRDFYKVNVLAGNWYILWAHSNTLDPTTQLPAGDPDTVMRIYDADKKLVQEIDDMPYRIQETDSAHMFQAPADGVMYVEILEWSDWDPDTSAQGSAGMIYRMTIGEFELGDNMEVNDTTLETFTGQVEGGFSWSVNPFDPNPDEASYPYWGHGSMDTKGDSDVYMITSGGDFFYSFGFWPDTISLLDPSFTVWYEDCTLGEEDYGDCDGLDAVQVAYNDDPNSHPDGYGKEDAGALIYTRPGVYYVQIEDANDNFGPGYSYSNLVNAFTYLDELFVTELESDVENVDGSTELIHRSFNDGKSSQAFFYGTFEPLTGDTDKYDAYKIDAVTVVDNYLSVWIDAADDGSMAGDLKMEIMRADGTVVTSDEGTDPRVENFKLGANDNELYIVLTSDGAEQGHQAFYNGRLYVTPEEF